MNGHTVVLLVLAASGVCAGAARAAGTEDPVTNLLPPAITGAETLPPVRSPEISQPAPGGAARGTSAPGVTVQRSGERLLITIRMADAGTAKMTQSENEVLLALPRALPPFNLQTLLDQSGGLLTGASVGFDTLLLQLAPGTAVARTESSNEVRIAVEPGGASGQAASSTPAQGEVRLRLLDAQLLAREGDAGAAREKLQALQPLMPDSPEPLAALAGIDQQQGRWRLALDEYQKANAMDPGNPSLQDAIASIDRAQGSRIRADLEYRQTDGGFGTSGITSGVFEGLSGHQLFGDGWRVGFAADLAQIHSTGVQRADGTVTDFNGPRNRTEIYLQHDWLEGQVAGLSVYSNDHSVGVGVHAELPDSNGMTLLRAEYRRPDWDFFQSIINQGTRDRIALGRRQQFGQDLTGRLEVAVNRYNVQHLSDVDRTVTLTGELRLGNLGGIAGLSVGYVLDAEYVFQRSKRIAQTGQLYSPLDLVDREVHAVTLAYAGALGTIANGQFTYEFAGGYGADRYGKAGPLVGGAIGYSVGHFEGRLRANYVQNIGRSTGTTQIYGANLAWIF